MPRATCATSMQLKAKLDERLAREGRDGAGPGLFRLPSRRAPCSTSPAGPSRTFSPTTADVAKPPPASARQAALGGPGQRPRPARRAGPRSRLPSAVGVLHRRACCSPRSTSSGDVSFILDKKKVDNAPGADAGRSGALCRHRRQGPAVHHVRPTARSSRVPTCRWSTSRECSPSLHLAAGPLQHRRQQRALQYRHAADRDRRAGAGRRARRLPSRHQRRDGRSQAAPARQRRAGVGRDAARPVPRRAAPRRSWRAHRHARWRRSLENRARGASDDATCGFLASSLQVCAGAFRRRAALGADRRAADVGAQGP